MPFPNPATQFKPGQSGNPGGRSKVKILTGILGDMLAANDKADAKAIIVALVYQAKQGSIAHIKEVLDRTEGKVADRIEMSGQKPELQWSDDESPNDPDAEAPPGAIGSEEVAGEIQGPGVRKALGQDETGGGPLP